MNGNSESAAFRLSLSVLPIGYDGVVASAVVSRPGKRPWLCCCWVTRRPVMWLRLSRISVMSSSNLRLSIYPDGKEMGEWRRIPRLLNSPGRRGIGGYTVHAVGIVRLAEAASGSPTVAFGSTAPADVAGYRRLPPLILPHAGDTGKSLVVWFAWQWGAVVECCRRTTGSPSWVTRHNGIPVHLLNLRDPP